MSTPSIQPLETSAYEEAIRIYRALTGAYATVEVMGVNHQGAVPEVIEILAHQDSTQRSLIQQEYRRIYNQELVTHLCSMVNGNLAEALDILMLIPAARDAQIINRAFCSESFNLQAVTEVLCSRTPSEIQDIKQEYSQIFGVSLQHDIRRETSGYHKKLLLMLLSSNPRCRVINCHGGDLFTEDAISLYKAQPKCWETNWQTYIDIFSKHSKQNLNAINSAYERMYGSLEQVIETSTERHFKRGLLTMLKCSANSARYFAEVLHEAMQGRGTDHPALIRVIVTRAEVDMQHIKAEYKKKYLKTLNDAVHEKTSGHYRTFLLSLLGPNNARKRLANVV